MSTSTRALSTAALLTLLSIAAMMGANHVAARLAFNHGVDVATAVMLRSGVTALVVGALVLATGVPLALNARHRRALPAIGAAGGGAEPVPVCIRGAAAGGAGTAGLQHLPAVDGAVGARGLPAPARARVLRAMPVMLLGLALALDVLGAASGLGAAGQWAQIGVGVAFALGAAATFGLALVLTQHEAGDAGRPPAHRADHGQVGLLAGRRAWHGRARTCPCRRRLAGGWCC
jgi:hypothetical protein